jgi:hypothetical protein
LGMKALDFTEWFLDSCVKEEVRGARNIVVECLV